MVDFIFLYLFSMDLIVLYNYFFKRKLIFRDRINNCSVSKSFILGKMNLFD